MFKSSALSVLFAALVAAAPDLEARNTVNCASINSLVTLLHEQAVATPFCSSFLHIPTLTSTSTQTSTPCAVTTTRTISSTDTITSTIVSTVSGTTTIYPVVAISTTSTCGLSQTVVQSNGVNQNVKRGYTTKCTTTATSVPLGTPTCLTKYPTSLISSGCSCLKIPTPTKVIVATVTAATSTVTKTIASTAHVTVSTTVTTTTFTSTYSATQYYTSTFTVLPPPASTIVASQAPSETFGAYANLDFNGADIDHLNCFTGVVTTSPYTGTQCQNFVDCVNECAYYNAQGLGTSKNVTCGAVVFNAPADLSSGTCYLKTTVYGCGGPNNYTNTAVILPLVATDPQ